MIKKSEELLLLYWIWSFLFILCPLQLPFLEWKNSLLLPLWNSFFRLIHLEEMRIFSDSQGFLLIILFSFLLAILSFLLALKWIRKKIDTVLYLLNYILLTSVFIVFIKYGLDKMMMLQFPRPEPNLLYTELKDFDKDLLFWTSMGTSSLFNYFSGGIEILCSLFLLFYRTRRLGLMILLLSASYIVLLNFSFNIGVKFFSLMLLGTLLTLNWNTLGFLYRFLLGFSEDKNRPVPVKIYVPILKGIIAVSALFYLFELNQQNTFSNKLMGAYQQIHSNDSKFLFINQQNYWVEKDEKKTIKAYQIVQQGEKALQLESDLGERKVILFSKKTGNNFTYTDENGNNFDYGKIQIKDFPVFKDEMIFLVK